MTENHNTSWQYKTILFFIKLVSLLPLWFFYVVSDVIFFLGYYIFGYRKKVVAANLKNSFPEKTESDRLKIQKKFYRNFCDWIVESIKGQTIRKKNLQKRVKIVGGLDLINDLVARKKSIISMNAHSFNWEWLSITPTIYPKEMQIFSIYYPGTHRLFTDLQNHLRERFGLTAIASPDTLRAVLQNDKEQMLGFYYFFADQTPPKDNPFWTTFLNQETSFFLGSEKIASKLNYAVVFLDVFKSRRGYYEIRFKLLCDNSQETEKFEITRSYVQTLEENIRLHPENWLWSHRRWKHKRPENIPLTPL